MEGFGMNTSPGSPYANDTDISGNETDRSINLFAGANNTDTRGALFNNVGRDQINHHRTTGAIQMPSVSVQFICFILIAPILEILGKYNVPGAAHDSSQREYAPSCVPNTYKDVMEKIWDWVGENNGHPMCLLTGAAGLGKSTIAQALATRCAGSNEIVVSFFFSQIIPECCRISRVILTLAYQLAVSIPAMQGPITEVFQADPFIPGKNLKTQFTKLVYHPILAIKHLHPRIIVIVDALNECEDKDGVLKLIEIITGVFQAEGTFPLRFFFYQPARGAHCIGICGIGNYAKNQSAGS